GAEARRRKIPTGHDPGRRGAFAKLWQRTLAQSRVRKRSGPPPRCARIAAGAYSARSPRGVAGYKIETITSGHSSIERPTANGPVGAGSSTGSSRSIQSASTARMATSARLARKRRKALYRINLHRPHRQLQNLAVREVVHGRIVEVEGVGELLLVVGHEGEAVVARLGAVEQLLHVRALAVVGVDAQHAVELVRADRKIVGRIVDELDRVDLLRIDVALGVLLGLAAGAGEPRLLFLEQHQACRALGHGHDPAVEVDVLLGVAGVAELREQIDHVLKPVARAGEGHLVVRVGDPDVTAGVLRQLDAALQRVERDRGKTEALGRGLEEIVAVRVLDQVLARVVDGRLARLLAPEVVRQVEGANELFEDLRVPLGLT